MVHPIFSVLISRPELVVDHVAGYAALAREEASSVGTEVARRAIAWGVAVMLGVLQGSFHWVLVLIPALPLALAASAQQVARKPLPSQAFAELRAQLDADAQTLRTLGARA